jgi:hypothetical protein
MATSPGLAWLVVAMALGSVMPGGAEEPVSFNRHIRPILSENCFGCHGFDAKHRDAGLRLDTFEGATADNDGVRAIVPGDPEASELWARVNSGDKSEVMPPPKSHKQPLGATERALLRAWIEQGAVYEPHWAFIPPQRAAAPDGGDGHVIDAHIRKRLEDEGLGMAPEAPPEKLARRASLDLTGLPPTPAELDVFLAHWRKSPEGAYDALLERLLASPHFGEKWGRWWLDQARYADSNGYSIDAPRSIWKFRDWVVDALNSDMPFDRFTIEQLAGDLLPDAGESQRIATGFHRNTSINQEGGIDKEQFRVDSVFDRVATTGAVWLGLTVGCAQCHDHKFDPIEQREFYQLFAFFNNQDEPSIRVSDDGFDPQALERELREVQKPLEKMLAAGKAEQLAWEKGLKKDTIEKNYRGLKTALGKSWDKRTVAENASIFAASLGPMDAGFRFLHERFKQISGKLASGVTTLVLAELPKPRRTTLFIQGDFTRPADEVGPGTPAVLHGYHNLTGANNRLDLAKWIVSKDNPLTARVIMNRVWQQLFGRGLVETENDFGSQGSLPTHPELLDWLALEFQERDWSLKQMLLVMMRSAAYRQDSADRPELREKDPDNYLLGRQQRIRLDAELVRDAALTASGLLAPKIGGPPVFPPIPAGVMGLGQVKREWKESEGADRHRRGLYTFVYRATPPPALVVFDAPDGQQSCTRRPRSNTPLQALTLLNDAAFVEFAQAMEKIVREEGVSAAFLRCTSRQPADEELRLLEGLPPLSVARVLLNLDETITRD